MCVCVFVYVAIGAGYADIETAASLFAFNVCEWLCRIGNNVTSVV